MHAPASESNSQKKPVLTRVHYLAIVVGASSIIFQVADLAEVLRFSRQEILDGQWWRLITGNLVHLGYPHLALNLAGLLVISILLAPSMSVRQWSLTGLFSMLGVGLGLLIFDPELSWYVGLSGVLYGLLLGGAIADYRHQPFISIVLIVYTVGKIIWEQRFGAMESSETISGGTVIVNAHLYGMVAGGVAVCMMLGLLALAGKR